jgi:hypothetical protein
MIRYLGDPDAKTDDHFRDHFVNSEEAKAQLNSDFRITFGTKGSGKTALRRALTDIHADRYAATYVIDLDDLEFGQLYGQIQHLRGTSGTHEAQLATTIWRNVIATYCIESALQVDSMSSDIKERISAFLDGKGYMEAPTANFRLLHHIDIIFQLVAELGNAASSRSFAGPSGLTPSQLSALIRFPTFVELPLLIKEVSTIISGGGKKVCVCIDGLDSIVAQPNQLRTYLFAGLINAAYKLFMDSDLSQGFALKLFLPEEFASEARRMIWDQDKIHRFSELLCWTPKEFKALIYKRLFPLSKSKSNDFFNIWHEHFPDRVHNDPHKIEEPSLDYFLRHTLYRPRQVLFHLQEVFEKWEAQNSAWRVDKTFIPKIVARTNWVLSQQVIDSLQHTCPYLESLMKSFGGYECIMTTKCVTDRIRKFTPYHHTTDVKHCLHELIAWGFFGVGDAQSIDHGFLFSYSDPHAVNHFPHDDVLLAISPMFTEFCGTKPSSHGPVIPRTMQ